MTDRKAKPPFEKLPKEIAGFDWLSAVNRSPEHGTSLNDIKVAAALARHYNVDHAVVWPTEETLVDLTGLHRVKVSKALSRLQESGAISRVVISKLPNEVRAKIKRHGRGKVTAFNFTWAYDTLQASLRTRRQEPPQLKAARAGKKCHLA